VYCPWHLAGNRWQAGMRLLSIVLSIGVDGLEGRGDVLETSGDITWITQWERMQRNARIEMVLLFMIAMMKREENIPPSQN
jgi:hypothetical protein